MTCIALVKLDYGDPAGRFLLPSGQATSPSADFILEAKKNISKRSIVVNKTALIGAGKTQLGLLFRHIFQLFALQVPQLQGYQLSSE